MEILISEIRSSPFQPRLIFDTEELKREIETDGLLSPLIVRKVDEHYELIDGERRFRAIKELGWNKVNVEVRDLDDRLAKVSIWKLNTIRESYSTEERGKYFKKLVDSGMTFYQVAKELNISDQWVNAHVNVFKFPTDIQNAVWEGQISIAHIQELESIISANIDEASQIAKTILERRLTRDELRKSITDRMKVVQEARLTAAREAIKEIVPRGTISVDLKEPRELEKAGRALLEEAKKKKEESLTSEDKARLERYREHRQESAAQARKTLEDRMRTKVEEEVRKERSAELFKDPEAVKELVKRPEFKQALELMKVEELAQPPEKVEILHHWSEGLEEEPMSTQWANWWRWNLSRIGNGFDYYTTSYAQKDIETFIETLKIAGVKTLIDVRDTPVSQFKPEFNKGNLSQSLRNVGINYVHYPELGVPRERRDELAKTNDWKSFFKWYDENVLPRLDSKLNGEKLLALDKPYAFMCVEKDPTHCHRHRIALELEKRGYRGFDL